jgi:hypothetical protein
LRWGTGHPLPAQALTSFDPRNPTGRQSEFSYNPNSINLKTNYFAPEALSKADGNGPCVAGDVGTFCNERNSLSLQFDKNVKLVDFTVKFNGTGDDASDSWILKFSQGSSSSIQTDVSEGTHLFSNQFVAAAGSPINMIAIPNNDPQSLQFSSLTVELASPPPTAVPGPLPLLGVAAAFGYSRKVRRRVASSRP